MITGQTIAIKQNASNSDLQRAIEAAIPRAKQQARSFANRYKGRTEQDSCKKIFDYLSNNINYKADGPNQAVRLPSGLMRTAQGDCKSYSIFTSAVLSNLGIPHSLCYVSYDPKDPTPSHIYVITDKGCIIDAVYGKFNAEKKPSYKKLKKMNISLISGIKKRNASIGRSCGYSGIMAIDTGETWAKKLGIWNSLAGSIKLEFFGNLVLPPTVLGREAIKAILRKNAGGLATALNKTFEVARANNATDEFRKYRDLEIKWLRKGGNPDDLRVAFQEGSKKTPTGPYFNELLKRKAAGGNVNISQYIAGAVNALFGKKYNETTGQITGSGTLINGEPVTLASIVASAPVWVPLLVMVVDIIKGPNLGTASPPLSGDNNNTGDGSGEAAVKSALLPILLIGGAAAAYFILSKKK